MIEILNKLIFKNPALQQILLENIDFLFSLLNKNIPTSKLISSILGNIKNDQKIFPYIYKIFSMNNSIISNQYFQIHCFKIFKTLMVDNYFNCNIHVKKTILSNILKIQELTISLKSNCYIEFMEDIFMESKNMNNEYLINSHLELIDMLGNLATNFRFGVIQLKKIFSYENTKSLLTSPKTPFIFKKSYLRCLYQV